MSDPLYEFSKYLESKFSLTTILSVGITLWIIVFIFFVRLNFRDQKKKALKRKEFEEAEKILCAATWFDDGKEYLYQPKNIKTGLVFCGYRHATLFQQIGGTVGERKDLGIFEKEQGFLTDKNRFVGREEALQIALFKNQVKDVKEVRGDRLFSEDLY